MDKRKTENLRVRKAITDALFELMKNQPLSTVSVSEIIRKAGVARVSFYRNFDSKEDVLVGLVRYVLDDFRENSDYDLSDNLTLKHILRTLEYYYQYRSYVLNLHHSGYSAMLLDELNQFHVSVAGDMPVSSERRYQLYVFVGAIYNTVIYWLNESNPAPAETVAKSILESLAGQE